MASVVPSDWTSSPGMDVIINCLYYGMSYPQEFNWWLNGTQLDNTTLIPWHVAHTGNEGTLTFPNVSIELNNTMIRCEVTSTASESVYSNNATIIIKQLPSVNLLDVTIMNSTIMLTWSEDASFHVTCVEIGNNTQAPLFSECINGSEISYPLPPLNWCKVYLISLTPMLDDNNNGTALHTHFHFEISPVLISALLVLKNDIWQCTLGMSAGVCSATVTIIELDTGKIIEIDGDSLMISEFHINFTTPQLTVNRRYFINIEATNNPGLTRTYIATSTHDIENLVVSGDDFTVVYSDHSTASGALFSFMFITDSGDVDFDRSFLLALDRNHTLPFNLYPGYYRVYVYDIEHEGTLHNGVGYPAVTERLTAATDELPTERDAEGNSYSNLSCPVLFDITESGMSIKVECESPSDMMTFQVIAQLIDIGEVHKLYINQSMDQCTPVVVPVERNGKYHVSIFAIGDRMGILELDMNVPCKKSTVHVLSCEPAIATATLMSTTITAIIATTNWV